MHRLFKISARLATLLALSGAFPAHAVLADVPHGASANAPQSRVDRNAADASWAGVGSLKVGNRSFTAALIDPRHVLTAAHVINGADAGNISFILNPGGGASHRFAADAIFVHPGYQGFRPSSDGVVHDDLAIVQLSDPVPAGIPVYPLYTETLPAGTPLTFVSQGAVIHDISASARSHMKRVGGNAADVLLPDDDGSGRLEAFLFDLDGPELATNRLGFGTLGKGRETTFASGDSGSPAFLREGGRWYLAGVGTFVSQFLHGPAKQGVFGTGGGGMLVSGYSDWIAGTVGISRQAMRPVPEPGSVTLWLAGLATLGICVAGRSRVSRRCNQSATKRSRD